MKTRRASGIPVLVALGSLLAVSTPAAERHVATGGDDSGPGTAEVPFASIGRAVRGLAPGDVVWIHAGTYREHVLIEAQGTAEAPVLVAAWPDDAVVVDGAQIALPDEWGHGLIHLREAAHLELRGLRVVNSAANGIYGDRSEHIVVRGTSTYDTVSSGIGIWNSRFVTVISNEVELACNDGAQECLTVAECEDFEISYNHVHHGGPGSHGGEGIDAKHSRRGRIFGNNVHDNNRLGIYIDAWDDHMSQIEVFANLSHHNDSWGICLAAEAGGLLEDVYVHDNLVFDNLHVGIGVESWGLDAAHRFEDILIAHNTIWRNGTPEWGVGIHLDAPEAEGVRIVNNILSENTTDTLAIGDPPLNLWIDTNLYHGAGPIIGHNPVLGDPLFVDPETVDLRLRVGSPAIDAGLPESLAPTDCSGTPRPQGSAPDIGAYEHVP